MKEEITGRIIGIFSRYFLLFLLIILSLYGLFYNLLLNITIYPASAILSSLFTTSVLNDQINVLANGHMFIVQIIPACVAVSAYGLFLILNLTTPMGLLKRAASLLFCFSILLVFNIIRIALFSILYINNAYLFNIMHIVFWYFLSIVLVVGVWWLNVYLFNIKGIPIYEDFKYLYSLYKK